MTARTKVFKDIDIHHQDVYLNLKELIKAQTGKEIPFSFRKDGDGKHIFTIFSERLKELKLSKKRLISINPWDIYVEIAQEFAKD